MKENKEQNIEHKTKRSLEGEVVSTVMDKTIVVQVKRISKHPLIGKIVRKVKKYKAHDEQSIAKRGDWVEIIECKPFSKTKHMQLVRVVKS